MKAAAMTPIAERSGLRGRGTLKEGGPKVVVRSGNVVSLWLISAGIFDQSGEEEDWDEEQEGNGVMIGCVREQKEQDGKEGRE
jgi:hypothetical protein